MSRVLMEPVKGMSEKEKRLAYETGHRLQRMIAKLLHEEHVSHAAGIQLHACQHLRPKDKPTNGSGQRSR